MVLYKKDKSEVVIMECKSNNDFYFSFIPIFNNNNEFSDFLLMDVNDSFVDLFNIEKDKIVGKKVTDIIVNFHDFFPSFKYIYYNMTPGNNKKYRKYLVELKKNYLINVFTLTDFRTYIYFSDLSFTNK